jgi:anti-anti-sigma regulatory factor
MLEVHADDRGSVRVELREPALVHDLSRLRSQLAHTLLRGRGGVTVDLSAVGRISSPTVAALLWARRSCAARSVPFSVTGCSGHNAGVLRTCGLVAGPGRGEAW